MRTRPTYKRKHVIAAVAMIMALSWLTVCIPYVYSAQKELAKQESRSAPLGSPIDTEESNPLSNTTEEKVPTNTPSEEYIHHTDDHNYFLGGKTYQDNRHSYDVYIAYHGEVQCPPPNSLS